jgi:hypothetical protein
MILKNKFHKKAMDKKLIYEGIDEELVTLNHEELTKKLHRSIDKILLAHRNSKIFLVLMSGPFLIALYIVKYALKIFIIYYLLKPKHKEKKTDSKGIEEEKKTVTN